MLGSFQVKASAEKLGGSAGNTAEVGFYEAKPDPPIIGGSKTPPTGKTGATSIFPKTGEEMTAWGIGALGIVLVYIAVKKLASKGGDSHG
ncbi:hypothetical protein [Vagococcus zengguangii]|uniref:Uncharacterized protein n=1 Tax=Vagococcus zengguangii TaxID=2571750 RepID=A0A4D7CSL6_9ENTE|nr:hypothetical protein [Vagococcus zengguangii]QCI85471.1 hypothetical protein FA707_00150 [Vagococcus zengguangii]TLG80016.1 hypothetical protein FE258_06705 [Vagococcus zengguangii]